MSGRMKVLYRGGRLPLRPILISALLAFTAIQWGQAGWIQAKAVLAQILIREAWSESLSQAGQPVKPWQWADTWPVARITWQSQNGTAQEDQVVLSNAQGESLAFGPTVIAQNPAHASNRWWVIAGHNDTHFAFLRQVKTGDSVTLQSEDGRWHSFVVQGQHIARASEPLLLDTLPPGLMLITCYPFRPISNPEQRLVVYAAPLEQDFHRKMAPEPEIVAF